MSFYSTTSRNTVPMRENLLLLMSELEQNPLYQKQANKNVGDRLERVYILSRQSHSDLVTTLEAGATSRDSLIIIKQLDADQLMKFKDRVDELLSRVIVLNKDNTIGVMPPKPAEKKPLPEIEMQVQIKNPNKQVPLKHIGTVKVHAITEQELDTINQATIEARMSLQVLAQPPSDTAFSNKKISPKISKPTDINPIVTARRQEHKPASQKEKKIDHLKETEKSNVNAKQEQQKRELRKSGEKMAEENRKAKERVQEGKLEHRQRIADENKKMKEK